MAPDSVVHSGDVDRRASSRSEIDVVGSDRADLELIDLDRVYRGA